VLTRDGDYFLPLRERINRARKLQADMFVSVHADAVRDRSVRGSSVYVLSARGASNEAAKWLADQENAADLIGGVSLGGKDEVLKSVLLDLSQGASMSASTEAADKVLEQLDRIGNVHKQSVQNAGFVVLKSPDIPSMLVETAFISNVEEEARLSDARHQQRLAEAIHAGVRSYFTANPPPGTAFSKSMANDRLVQNGPASAPVAGVR
jgi:N-acetylmuramoyl-L-alanine amidase